MSSVKYLETKGAHFPLQRDPLHGPPYAKVLNADSASMKQNLQGKKFTEKQNLNLPLTAGTASILFTTVYIAFTLYYYKYSEVI